MPKIEYKDNMYGLKFTNPDKLLFDDPKVTKLEVAQYYIQVAKRMLPYVENRILSLVVCPKGIDDPCFYKKHPMASSQGEHLKSFLNAQASLMPLSNEGVIKTVPVVNSEGEESVYTYVTDAAGLIAEVQMNTLEFHVWGSKADNLDKPDVMVFDLDPDEGMELPQVRQGVRDLKSILDILGLISFLKTSGNKGYHIVVPFGVGADWDAFNGFAKKVAQAMEQKWPNLYTSNVRKLNRKGKIFIDWIRNGKGATSIAPYSIRAKRGARVSMPISWGELDTVAPNEITMGEAVRRCKGPDPWAGFKKVQAKQKIK